ncbi:flagellar hook-associated protein FlgL [Saliterribacillus persicus]|uniref:Flagellar hook-associated protein 3 FlgL n=1 Tax=Saliterribacillus persicus TaxID=930114 RepID=A0A368Y7D8_9BACI|nr:flagellar hook-associated protein FlgL [Saliterribacillus persicus]RCW74727.1 flagellar hook-associated protein 3 FlgL [Saliterribacillus persicus]
MRVTQGMLTNNMLRNLSNSYGSLGKYMEQLSTGKKINRPSDDPVIAMKGMNYRTQVKNVEQYQRNIGEVHNWMDNTDSALDKVQKGLSRLRDLAVQGSNGTYEDGQRGSIASEVDQLKQHLVEIANTKVNNKYIFNGTGTTGTIDGAGDEQPPVTLDADGNVVTVPTNNGAVNIEVSNGSKIQANIDPTNLFSEDLFKDMEDFAAALRNGADTDALGAFIGTIDGHIDNNVNERADLGARQNRIELIENRVLEQEVTAKNMMSNNEDADMEKVIMNLTSQESVHRAALSSGSRVIQPTLLDFLR